MMEFCKDLGLQRLQQGIFLGKLKNNESRSLENLTRKCLPSITDNFYIIPLCKECWSKKISKQYENENKVLQPKKPFEIIE